jgi:hypothetical protein
MGVTNAAGLRADRWVGRGLFFFGAVIGASERLCAEPHQSTILGGLCGRTLAGRDRQRAKSCARLSPQSWTRVVARRFTRAPIAFHMPQRFHRLVKIARARGSLTPLAPHSACCRETPPCGLTITFRFTARQVEPPVLTRAGSTDKGQWLPDASPRLAIAAEHVLLVPVEIALLLQGRLQTQPAPVNSDLRGFEGTLADVRDLLCRQFFELVQHEC